MAKVKFGMFMTDARGKVGGQVFSKNRGGAYVRTKVTPSNPRTADQQANRSLLGSLSQSWSSLTESARLSFNNAVASWTSTNIFGDTTTPSGKNLFVKINKNLNAIGLATIETAPEKVEMPILGLESVTVDISSAEINVVASAVTTDEYYSISATPPLTQGTYNFKNKLRHIYSVLGTGLGSDDLYNAYIAKFGAPAVGANIHFEIKIVATNGQMSVPEGAKATVQA